VKRFGRVVWLYLACAACGIDFVLYSGRWSPSPNENLSDIAEVTTLIGGRRAHLTAG
jgi:hypothetical protein